jgi:hypothetical protein
LRARRAADCVGGMVFVNVVVVLGTEPELAVRSSGDSCASGDGAWVMMAGSEDSATWSGGSRLSAPQSVESTPSEMCWRVVVAGVTVGGSALLGVVSAT